MHFEVYKDAAAAASGRAKVATSQLAMLEVECHEVFATTSYEARVRKFQRVALATDIAFKDGATSQLPAIRGNVINGYEAR